MVAGHRCKYALQRSSMRMAQKSAVHSTVMVVMPDADLSAEDADVSAICTPVFTDAVKAAYQTHLSSQE